jgi:AhpD family alkylhydroperoxidase
MSFLPPLSDQQAGPVADVFQAVEGRFGFVPNMYRTLAHARPVVQASLSMAAAIRQNLDPVLRELAYLKTAQALSCAYCSHYHQSLGQKAGLSSERIDQVADFENSELYSELEKDVLRFAEQWTVRGAVDAAVIERLARSLSPTELVTLAATVAQANFTSRFNVVFGVALP